MRVTGIIAEYNPFHNGHKYQLNEVKKSCDAIVVIMSGSFVQRGDAAVFDKWTRAEAALENGADLVIELPVCYALNTAERFAYGSVATLDALGVVDTLCFGSEYGSIDELVKSAVLLETEPPEVSGKIRSLMNSGLSYPSAREKAFDGYIRSDILSKPNNILAVEYIRILKRLKSNITPMTIKRHMTDHNSDITADNFASATKVRDMIRSGEDYSKYVPAKYGSNIYDISKLDSAVTAMLRTVSADYLKSINDVSEGLENRIISSAREHTTIKEIAESVKTKRYTQTRINRILLSALLGITGDLSKLAPEYIRVLGMNRTGMKILSEAKKKSSLPIITKASKFSVESKLFEKDILSTDIFALCASDSDERKSGHDFVKSPIILN